MGFGLFATLTPLFLKEIGATPTDIGVVFGGGSAAAALTFLPIGLAADRWGTKPLLVATWFASMVGGAAFLPLSDWHGALIGSFLYNVGNAAFPLLSAHLAASTPRARLGSELGIVYGAFFFGTIFASPFAGPLGAAIGLQVNTTGAAVTSTTVTVGGAFWNASRGSPFFQPSRARTSVSWAAVGSARGAVRPRPTKAASAPAPIVG